MERTFRDFRQRLEDLKDRRVRICFTVVDTEKGYEYYGWIRALNEHTLEFEADTSTGDAHLTRSHFNLEALVVYAVDEVDPEADLAEGEKGKYGDVESIRSVAINEADALIREGYEVVEMYAKTVTLVRRTKEVET